MENSNSRRRGPVSQPQSYKQASSGEFLALNALIQDRGVQWSEQARAIKFDIEFKATEHEKRRVAKELHDDILPELARLIRSIQSNQDASSTETIVEELHNAVASFRDLLGELHAVDLEECGLVSAIDNLCKRYNRLTGKSIIFVCDSEECNLSDLQMLSLYRAVQATLRIFEDSNCEILVIEYLQHKGQSFITARCIDKTVSSAEWLSDHPDCGTLESWCRMAGAQFEIGSQNRSLSDRLTDQFPYDLALVVSGAQPPGADTFAQIDELTQVRLIELDSIIAVAQEEWTEIFNRDCELFKKLAVEMERKNISNNIARLIKPRLERVAILARKLKGNRLSSEVQQKMQEILAGVNAILSELHASVLEKIGLVNSIRTLVNRFRHATLIETTMISNLNLWSEQVDAIPLAKKFELYRIAQEALNNIEKHSDATRALVVITKNVDELVLCIEDNGKGLRLAGTTLSRGMRNIKERAVAIGAQANWSRSSSFDSGTLVSISLACPGLVIDNHVAPRVLQQHR